MKDKEILKKVIEKAVKNGWRVKQSWLRDARANIDNVFVELVIFNHRFAEAFFGKEMEYCMLKDRTLPEWRHRQHEMLDEIQEGRCPIKYLEKFL